MDVIELLSDYANYLREKKDQGKKIIGFMGHDNIPEELLDAAGFIPLRMIFAGNDDLMNASNDYLPPSTCSFAQSCIGLFSLQPSQYNFLNLIDQFIVSNHCVSDICTSEIITKYFNISRLNFYVSYTQGPEALKYFKLELLDLKQQLDDVDSSLPDAKEKLISYGPRYRDMIAQLELENEKIEGAKAGLRQLLLRKKKQRISRVAFDRSREDYLKTIKRATSAVDRILLSIREEAGDV